MSAIVIWNGRAGSAAGISVDDARARLTAALGHEVSFVDAASGDCGAHARDVLARGAQLLIAAGGDGTVSACATVLLGHPTAALGVLPLGTSNSFAAALDIPGDVDGAIATLAAGNRRRLDAAVVARAGEQRTMILHCMVGFHAETIEDTSSAAKRRWGVLAYAATALRKLASLEPFAAELVTRSHVVRCRAVAIGAANIAPQKTVLAHGPSHLLGDDGRVDVTIVSAETIAEAIATGVHLYRTGASHEPASRDNVGSFSTPHVEVRTDPPQHVLVDGEPFGVTPVTIDTLPGALTVIAPAPGEALGDPVEAPLLGLPDLEIEPR